LEEALSDTLEEAPGKLLLQKLISQLWRNRWYK